MYMVIRRTQEWRIDVDDTDSVALNNINEILRRDGLDGDDMAERVTRAGHGYLRQDSAYESLAEYGDLETDDWEVADYETPVPLCADCGEPEDDCVCESDDDNVSSTRFQETYTPTPTADGQVNMYARYTPFPVR